MEKLPISAMIVGYNEEKFLPQCFESISFCDEIIYTDLGSTDDSINIATNFAQTILEREKVPSCEMIQAEVVHYLKNDWVLFLDPDERVDVSLAIEIQEKFKDFSNNEKLGAVMVPWQFYFKKKKLKGTPWGGINKKYFLVNRHRFLFEPIVHYGRKLLPEFNATEILFDGNQNVLHHYWMNSYSVFFKKHCRYLKNEGMDQYNQGIRSGYKKIFLSPFKEFHFSFITTKGYKDGLLGFFLSAFWAFYKTYIAIDILKIQRAKRRLL